MDDMNEPKPKPIDFGFGDDFPDLSQIKPNSPRKTAAKPVSKPKPEPKAIKSVEPEQGRAPIRAQRPAVLEQRAVASDKIAKTLGFASREQAPAPMLLKKRRRTQHNEPVDQLSIRGPVRILNDFITYCEASGLSYWEALEALLAADSSSSIPRK